jgi:hypothetical protein
MMSTFSRRNRWIPVYNDPADDDLEDKDKNKDKDNEKKFTQKDLERLLDQRFKKERIEKEKLLAQLEAIKTDGLTPEAKEELEGQISNLQESLQTKEQTLQQKMAETEKKYSKDLEKVIGERDTWRNRFQRSILERSILDGAVGSEAEDPSQFVLMFGSAARLEEEFDASGKGTGNFIPKLKFKGIDPESKKPVDLDLPVGEAFAHMREHGLHKNLFKHGAASGTGKTGNGSGGGKTGGESEPMRESFQSEEAYSTAYQGWRNTHELDGTPIQSS